MSPIASTFRSKRKVAGITAALAAGSALIATPILIGGIGNASEHVATTSAAHQIAFRPDPGGSGGDLFQLPKPPAPAPAQAAQAAPKKDTTNGSERASRSTTRKSISSSGSTSTGGSPQAIAQSQLASRGWSGQFSCLNSLWNKESGWKVSAANPSGAYGIPQALPGSKMSSAGSDWRTNPATQITWGLNYISSTYGSPCAAWSQSQAQGWY